MTLPIWAKPGYLSLSIWPRVNFQSNQFLKDVWQSLVPSEHSQSGWWGHGRNPFTPANDLSSCIVRATCLWESPFILPLNILFQQCASLPCRKKKKTLTYDAASEEGKPGEDMLGAVRFDSSPGIAGHVCRRQPYFNASGAEMKC